MKSGEIFYKMNKENIELINEIYIILEGLFLKDGRRDISADLIGFELPWGKKQNNVKVTDKYKKATQERAKEAKLEK